MYPTDSASPLREVITGNIKAQRARMRLKQADVAERMRALGLPWHQQTTGAVERGEKILTAEELVWLAVCLGTTPAVLMQPQSAAVTSPSGLKVSAQRIYAIDNSVTFDGNVPVISAVAPMPAPEQRIAELEARMEALGEFNRDVRRAARRQPQQDTGTVSSEDTDAVDIPPRSGRSRKRSK
jgi:transcriptional regulator with XRE-family HTH domain